MKLVFIFGDAAVGKMTVGQELMKITDLRLFHNHMTIEPVLEIMGRFDGQLINDMRELIFRRFAASDNYGLIFTYMMAFDMQSDWDYVEHVKSIFNLRNGEVNKRAVAKLDRMNRWLNTSNDFSYTMEDREV